MKRATVTLASALTALLLGTVSMLSPLAVGAAAQQHGADLADGPAAGQVSSPRNAIQAQAAPGVVQLESFRFT